MRAFTKCVVFDQQKVVKCFDVEVECWNQLIENLMNSNNCTHMCSLCGKLCLKTKFKYNVEIICHSLSLLLLLFFAQYSCVFFPSNLAAVRKKIGCNQALNICKLVLAVEHLVRICFVKRFEDFLTELKNNGSTVSQKTLKTKAKTKTRINRKRFR